MQATRSSAAMSAVGGSGGGAVDISDAHPAGGYANDLLKSEIDFEDSQRRPLRRSLSVPRRHAAATTASIAEPTRGEPMGGMGGQMPLESPRELASRRLAEAGMFAGEGPPPQAPASARAPPPVAGTPVRVDRPHGVRRPPTAPNMFGGPAPFGAFDKPVRVSHYSSHDKSIPNPSRSRKGVGRYVPGPAVTTDYALASAPPAFITDAGFESQPMHRRGKVANEPAITQRSGAIAGPQALSNPNDAGSHDRGARADQSNQMLLGPRRRRGTYSPAVPMGGSNPLAWNATPG
jgi:hypothetical protein